MKNLTNLFLILISTIICQLFLYVSNFYNYSLNQFFNTWQAEGKVLIKFFDLPLSLIISFIGSLMAFFYSLFLWNGFNFNNPTFQWVEYKLTILPHFGIDFCIGVDAVSLLMVLLTTFIMPLSFLTLLDRTKKEIMWMSLTLLFLEIFIILAFVALDIYLFYVAFEAVLIPMFFLIGLGGSRKRKSKAAYYLFFYTLAGSLLMLVAIIVLHSAYGSSNFQFIFYSPNLLEQDYRFYLMVFFFIAFAVKTPIFPLHLWLPEAHVEAPTTGSIILAALLLKLGTYGIYRYCILLFPYTSFILKPVIFTILIISMTITSLIALRQIDLKRVVAYSSVVHMSYCLLGLFAFNIIGIKGSFMLMVAHGLVSGGLFALVGVLYERYGTRYIHYYGGLAQVMPQTALLFFIAVLGNISFPISASFIGEFAVFIGAMQVSKILMVFVIFSLIISTAYTIFLFNRVFFGGLKTTYIKVFKEINKIEFLIIFLLLYPMVFLGLFPDLILNPLDITLSYHNEIIMDKVINHNYYLIPKNCDLNITSWVENLFYFEAVEVNNFFKWESANKINFPLLKIN